MSAALPARFFRSLLAALVFFLLAAIPAYAQVSPNVTGIWTVTVTPPQRLNSTQSWTLAQAGTTLSGTGRAGPSVFTSLGSVFGTTFSKVDRYTTFTEGTYTITWSGTVSDDSSTMGGTWVSSLGPMGDWSAVRGGGLLTPGTKLNLAPTTQRVPGSGNTFTFTFTLLQFDQVKFRGFTTTFGRAVDNLASMARRKGKVAIKYNLTVKDKTKSSKIRKVSSKKNIIAVKNLKPGNYTASYNVSAERDGKKIFSTNESPAIDLTVQ